MSNWFAKPLNSPIIQQIHFAGLPTTGIWLSGICRKFDIWQPDDQRHPGGFRNGGRQGRLQQLQEQHRPHPHPVRIVGNRSSKVFIGLDNNVQLVRFQLDKLSSDSRRGKGTSHRSNHNSSGCSFKRRSIPVHPHVGSLQNVNLEHVLSAADVEFADRKAEGQRDSSEGHVERGDERGLGRPKQSLSVSRKLVQLESGLQTRLRVAVTIFRSSW